MFLEGSPTCIFGVFLQLFAAMLHLFNLCSNVFLCFSRFSLDLASGGPVAEHGPQTEPRQHRLEYVYGPIACNCHPQHVLPLSNRCSPCLFGLFRVFWHATCFGLPTQIASIQSAFEDWERTQNLQEPRECSLTLSISFYLALNSPPSGRQADGATVKTGHYSGTGLLDTPS